jgi:hypothetical protein
MSSTFLSTKANEMETAPDYVRHKTLDALGAYKHTFETGCDELCYTSCFQEITKKRFQAFWAGSVAGDPLICSPRISTRKRSMWNGSTQRYQSGRETSLDADFSLRIVQPSLRASLFWNTRLPASAARRCWSKRLRTSIDPLSPFETASIKKWLSFYSKRLASRRL